MLMIHVGPLITTVQAAQAAALTAALNADIARQVAQIADLQARHVHDAYVGQAAEPAQDAAHGHHRQGSSGEPAWLAALELCGYCELLTLNPPLSLPPQLVLPEHPPTFFLALPENPQPPAPRRSSGHPRAPPFSHS